MFFRCLIFALASSSFACLLGAFFGVWTMHAFGCLILPPATALLAWLAWKHRLDSDRARSPFTWIVEGSIGGIVAAVAYDLYRLPFVLTGAPLFRVFPRFGELLLEATEPRWLVHAIGWAYHFSNGAALGIMFLTLVPRHTRRALLWGAIAWALTVEVILLLTPYPQFFGLALNSRFIFLTASAHLIFGITLGLWFRWRLGSRLA